MAKNSGTTRAGNAGGSSQAQSTDSSGTGRVITRNFRLSDVEANIVAGRMLGRYQLVAQRRDVGGVNMYVSGFVESGTSIFVTDDSTFSTQEQAVRHAEELVKQRQDFEREGYSPRVKAIAEKAANEKESEAERDLLNAHDYTFYRGSGYVDIIRKGKRVAKGIRKNGKLEIKWYN